MLLRRSYNCDAQGAASVLCYGFDSGLLLLYIFDYREEA